LAGFETLGVGGDRLGPRSAANPAEKPIDEKFTAIDAACDFLS